MGRCTLEPTESTGSFHEMYLVARNSANRETLWEVIVIAF